MFVMAKAKDLFKKSLELRKYCTKIVNEDINIIRNIGILAHIDAGKTTTTERMLFYSGKIHSMGEVHNGNTVTDFLDQERERGITISSAAVSFQWKNHKINLIDTPGHIDFTMEVEKSLNVLDGAVVILDGSAGVEAQTVTVWRQADRYMLPRVIYINKMDRSDASLDINVSSLRNRLNIDPLLLHIPIYNSNCHLEGVIDVVGMVKRLWLGNDSHTFQSMTLKQDENPQIWEEAMSVRNKLVEKLSDCDDTLAEKIIDSESLDLPESTILESIRRVTIAQKCFPVVCGSSYKNIGVQLLMDTIVNFLPSPISTQRNQQIRYCFKDHLCARAFKVMHNSQKKTITFFRLYSGSFVKGQKIYNIQKEKTESVNKLMIPYADENIEVMTVSSGNIAAVSGLKETMTGDFVTSNANSASVAKKRLEKIKEWSWEENFGQTTKIPVPVFYCSIEAPSQAYQSQLDVALANLQREDPSLVVFQDDITGQTVIGGMGELHLDIIKQRIISEYKINVELGTLQIAYQEIPQKVDFLKKETYELNHKIGSSKQNVTITLSLHSKTDIDKDIVIFDKSSESASNIASLSPRHLLAIEQGVDRALRQGPKLNCPVVNTSVMLHWCEVSRSTSENMIAAAAAQCVQTILKTVGTRILEPLMLLEVVSDKECSAIVLSDLTRRRGIIQKLTVRGLQQVIDVQVPLAELLGFATELRQLTSGTGSFTMELDSYQPMSLTEEAKAIKRVTGFDP